MKAAGPRLLSRASGNPCRSGQTVYTQAALDHLVANGYPLDPADIARLSPLGHPTINLDGHYRTTSHPPTTGLRPLRAD